MKWIKKKRVVPLKEDYVGCVSNTLNVNDKTTNAPSIRLVEEMVGEFPTKVSELENDSGFVTAEEVPNEVSTSWTTDNDNALAPSINLLKNLFVVAQYNLNVPAMAAGSKGYFTLNITIPTGYKAFNVTVRTGQVANSQGLQLTPIYGHNFTTGSQTMYINYYAPGAIGTAFSCVVYIECIKSEVLPTG